MTNSPVPPRKRRFSLVWIVALGLIAALCAIWWYNHTGANADQMAGRRGGGGGGFGGGGGRRGFMNGPLPVVAVPVAKGDIHVYLNGLGTVTPLANVTIRTQVSGQLIQVAFQEGQMVHKGDLLAVVDPRPYQVALEQAQGQLLQAQAQLREAQADLSRYVTLQKQDSIAQQQVDSERALVAQDQGLVVSDQAAIDNAKLNLAYCHITAPVDGRVGLRQVDPGNYVTPGDSNGLVVLTQITPMSVIFTLPEDNVPEVARELRDGDKISVEAFDRTDSHKLASGSLATIDNEVDDTTGTFKLRATFPNEDLSLFPQQFVNIQMLLNVLHDVDVIPTSGVERNDQQTFVYLVKPDNTVTARAVTLGATEGERVQVLSGLNEGDRVVVDGADRLREGMEVTVQTPAQAAPPTVPLGGEQRHFRRRGGAGGQGNGSRRRGSGQGGGAPGPAGSGGSPGSGAGGASGGGTAP